MSVVKIMFVKHAKNLLRYVTDGRDGNDPVEAYNCSPNTASEDFDVIANLHHGLGDISAIHIVQSWNEDESKKVMPEEFNVMGKQMVETKFPGHAYLVVTHTNTGRTHNHIIVSPWHSESGKKIENKKRHLYELRSINDTICKERGLSVINGKAKDRAARMPDKAQRVMRFNSRSWLADLSQKADFGRAYATSYDEYVGILSEFGIKTRVEEKNITYFYPGKDRGKRGNKLGRVYDKHELEKQFRANDLKFTAIPGLKDKIRQTIGTGGDVKGKLSALPNTTYFPGHKDYSRFTHESRSCTQKVLPHQRDLLASMIPIEELRKARMSNIPKYCKERNIPLVQRPDGKTVLKGREFVEISEFSWRNTRNRTEGSLIEFVAAHQNLSILQAVAKINYHPRLLLLEKHFGEVGRKFTSFYVPKPQQAHNETGIQKALSLFTAHGLDRRHLAHGLRSELVHIDKSGLIRIFGKDDEHGALEFFQNGDCKWQRQTRGNVSKPFFSKSSKDRSARIYVDPLLFLKHHGSNALSSAKHSQDVLCLLEPNSRLVDQFITGNRFLANITFVTSADSKEHPIEIDFFNNLKSHCHSHGIKVDHNDKLDLGRGRGIDFSR